MIPLPTRIREMLGRASVAGQTVHDDNGPVIRDRREAVKALSETLRMDPEVWGELLPPQRWQTASRLIDLEWRYSHGWISDDPKAVTR